MKSSQLRFAVVGALVLAAAVLPLLAASYYVQFASKAMLMAVFALSLSIVVGYGGLVSMCHAAFFGLAGYMLGFLSPEDAGATLWWSLPAAMAVVAAAAAVIGALSLRTRGIYFIMVTLAFGEMLFYLFHDTKIGGGSDGLYIYYPPELVLGGASLLDLGNARTFYYVAFGLLLAAALLVRTLVSSPFGRALQASRDNEQRARSLGFPVFRIRLVAFVVSAMLASVAGYFSAAQFGFVAPQMLGWHASATVLVMVVLGGMTSILGPIAGAFALLGLEEVLKASIENWRLAKGLVVIAIVLLLPGGLQHLLAMVMPERAVRRSATAVGNDVPVSADAVKGVASHG